jgi:hypothetical protein
MKAVFIAAGLCVLNEDAARVLINALPLLSVNGWGTARWAGPVRVQRTETFSCTLPANALAGCGQQKPPRAQGTRVMFCTC